MEGLIFGILRYLISGPYERKRTRWIAFERVMTRTVAVGVRDVSRVFSGFSLRSTPKYPAIW